MRRLIPVLAVLALILPALATPASAEYVNHVGKVSVSTSSWRCAFTTLSEKQFWNFSIRLMINKDHKICLKSNDNVFLDIEILDTSNEVKVNDIVLGSATSITKYSWFYIYANTTTVRVAQYVIDNLTISSTITEIEIYSRYGTAWFDDVILDSEVIEDFEDANTIFSIGTQDSVTHEIVEDPSPIVIHNPNWGDTVEVPFSINYTNPAGAVENEIIVDYTTIATVQNVTENVSFEFQTQDIPPGWHTITIKAYNETGAEIGSTSIYLYVINEGYTPPEGDNSTASSGDSGDSGSSGSSTGGSTGSSGSAGDTGDSGFTEFADDVKTWFETETLNIPRWIWILTIVGVLLIGSGVRRL